jgi:hypothetical protein
VVDGYYNESDRPTKIMDEAQSHAHRTLLHSLLSQCIMLVEQEYIESTQEVKSYGGGPRKRDGFRSYSFQITKAWNTRFFAYLAWIPTRTFRFLEFRIDIESSEYAPSVPGSGRL